MKRDLGLLQRCEAFTTMLLAAIEANTKIKHFQVSEKKPNMFFSLLFFIFLTVTHTHRHTHTHRLYSISGSKSGPLTAPRMCERHLHLSQQLTLNWLSVMKTYGWSLGFLPWCLAASHPNLRTWVRTMETIYLFLCRSPIFFFFYYFCVPRLSRVPVPAVRTSSWSKKEWTTCASTFCCAHNMTW